MRSKWVVSMGLLVWLMLPGCLVGCDKVKELTGRMTSGQDKPAASAGEEAPVKTVRPGSLGRIAMLLAFEGYQDKEYEIPRAAFEEAGFEVEVVSFYAGQATGALGGRALVDCLLEDAVARVKDYRAVVLVGGPGSAFYHQEKKAHEFVQEAVKGGKVLGAICLAPFTLGHAGVLKGRRATVWTGGKFTPEAFAGTGAHYREGPVVVDEKIVTANGPTVAAQFAAEILKLLK